MLDMLHSNGQFSELLKYPLMDPFVKQYRDLQVVFMKLLIINNFTV